MKSKWILNSAFILILIGGGWAGWPFFGTTRAQEPGPPGTIRVQVTLVPVNVRVTDQNGKPVLDLGKSDFTIFENRVPQEIRHFSVERFTTQTPTPNQKVMLRRISPFELAPQSSRTFLILLGSGRIQRPFKSVDSIIQFVKDSLLPQDQVAVFAYNRATDFTTDRAKVVEVLERYKKYSEKIEAGLELRFSGLAAIYGSHDLPKSSQSDIDKIFLAPGALASRQVPRGRITDSGQIQQDTQQVTNALINPSTTSPFDQVAANGITDLPFEEYVSTAAMTHLDLQNIYTAIEYLRYVEGEKHLLFFSENGLFLPRLENDKSIAAMANDARVVIDTFQTGGVYSASGIQSTAPPFSAENSGRALGGPRMNMPPVQRPQNFNQGSFSRTFALTSLRNVAFMTGGMASIHSDISNALNQVNETSMGEYLLGYYPKNTNFNGAYRQIFVRVNRPGLKVSFRRGYYARDQLVPFDREAFLTYSRIAAAGAYRGEVNDIRFKATAHQNTSSPEKPEIQIDLNINPNAVPFQTSNDLHHGKLSITTFYGDSKGRYLGDSWETLEMNLKEDTYARVMKEGIPFTFRIPMQAPDESIKVVLYNYEIDKVGSVMIKAK
ncbi:MAG: VWA domain-containing protein [Acidobacteriia bacterium]|nr:VWA domain-containing protein [Terriglobia bacterium]